MLDTQPAFISNKIKLGCFALGFLILLCRGLRYHAPRGKLNDPSHSRALINLVVKLMLPGCMAVGATAVSINISERTAR